MKFMRFVFFSLTIFTLISCSTNLPEPDKQNEAILLIPVSTKNTSRSSMAYYLTFEFSNCVMDGVDSGQQYQYDYDGTIWPDKDTQYIAIPVLPVADCRLTKIIQRKYARHGVYSNKKYKVFDYSFSLKKGEITIFPKTLYIFQRKYNNYWYTYSFFFRNMYDREKKEIIKLLEQQENFSKWKSSF